MFKIIGIVICLVYVVENREIASLNSISDEVPNIISRQSWGARTANGPVSNLSENPPSYVVIHHSASPPCTSQALCQAKVRSFQDYHINHNHWSDIGYNFLVGEDGNVYEGRGWGKRGAHCPKYNPTSIGICVIGTFTDRVPNSAAIKALQNLISYGVSLGKIKSDYHLIGHRQGSSTTCPGNKLFELIKTFPHFDQNPK